MDKDDIILSDILTNSKLLSDKLQLFKRLSNTFKLNLEFSYDNIETYAIIVPQHLADKHSFTSNLDYIFITNNVNTVIIFNKREACYHPFRAPPEWK